MLRNVPLAREGWLKVFVGGREIQNDQYIDNNQSGLIDVEYPMSAGFYYTIFVYRESHRVEGAQFNAFTLYVNSSVTEEGKLNFGDVVARTTYTSPTKETTYRDDYFVSVTEQDQFIQFPENLTREQKSAIADGYYRNHTILGVFVPRGPAQALFKAGFQGDLLVFHAVNPIIPGQITEDFLLKAKPPQIWKLIIDYQIPMTANFDIRSIVDQILAWQARQYNVRRL